MTSATHILRLAHVVLCAELTTHPEFRGVSRNDPHLREIAYQFMSSPSAPRHYRECAKDAVIISEAVWWGYMRGHIKKMLVDIWGADEKEALQVIDKYFVDDSPQYDPSPRRR